MGSEPDTRTRHFLNKSERLWVKTTSPTIEMSSLLHKASAWWVTLSLSATVLDLLLWLVELVSDLLLNRRFLAEDLGASTASAEDVVRLKFDMKSGHCKVDFLSLQS
jgi:hypothetical protein